MVRRNRVYEARITEGERKVDQSSIKRKKNLQTHKHKD